MWGCIGLTIESKNALSYQHAGQSWYTDDTGTSAILKRLIEENAVVVKTRVTKIQQEGTPHATGILQVGIQQEFAHNEGQPWTCRFTTPWDGKGATVASLK